MNNTLINVHIKQHAILLLSAALGMLCLMTVSCALWQWRSDWILTHQTVDTPTVTPPDDTTTLIAALPDQHLFGKAFSSGTVPITNLQLLVTGIVKMSGDQTRLPSKAYISQAGQPSKIYQIGDSVASGIKIYAITTDTVILENDGHLEKLPLPRTTLQFKPRGEPW